MLEFLDKFPRIKALVDKSAWLLIAPALLISFLIDPVLFRTMLSWCVYVLAMAGATIVISRIVFPQVRLTEMVESALVDRNAGAGLVAAAVILFVGLVLLSIVIWGKA